MQDSWKKLLNKLGIADSFMVTSPRLQQHDVPDDLLKQMVNYLGFPLKNIDDSEKLLQKIENKRWQYALEPIYVVKKDNVQFDLILKDLIADVVTMCICDEQDNTVVVNYTQEKIAEKIIGKTKYSCSHIHIDTPLNIGYYSVKISDGDNVYHTTLAVVPDKCYVPEVLTSEKIWGFAIQLYSLRSKRNWGVGDFTDLQDFVRLCARQGADIIGINPLNVLFHDYPENASPYSSISRLFLNPIYIDVEKVPYYSAKMLDQYRDNLTAYRNSENIDYTGVYNLKINILRQIFDIFKQHPKDWTAFLAFCTQQGGDLDNLATYQAIYSEMKDKVYGGWSAWPAELKNPNSRAVNEFKNQHEDEVNFFKFLQYLTFLQFALVTAEIKQCGLKIGLYRDLPVGLCKDSVELWAGKDLFIKDCGAGAPPDVFFPKGQKWCLGAFNPYSLKASAYTPFIKILRAAMYGAGALRIDHVMSLMRLYIIPDCADDGTYVYYNFSDMLGILALESQRNKCMIVGESIGNVPDGFVEKLHDSDIYSLSVLWAERWHGQGDFKQPADFPCQAFCSVGTHDMAPLRMRWFGYDIELMYKLGMLSLEEKIQQYHGREDERCRLLRALDISGVWPHDKPRQSDCLFGEGYPNGLTEAVENYVSSSNGKVYLAQPEDIFGVEVLQNLPGTDRDKHPNWRRKLPISIEDMETNPDFIRARQAIKR